MDSNLEKYQKEIREALKGLSNSTIILNSRGIGNPKKFGMLASVIEARLNAEVDILKAEKEKYKKMHTKQYDYEYDDYEYDDYFYISNKPLQLYRRFEYSNDNDDILSWIEIRMFHCTTPEWLKNKLSRLPIRETINKLCYNITKFFKRKLLNSRSGYIPWRRRRCM